MLEDVIYQAINEHIRCNYLDVNGDGRHFDAIIVSDEFTNKKLIERHRMVYAALGNKMKHEIHALSIKVYTNMEWEQLHG